MKKNLLNKYYYYPWSRPINWFINIKSYFNSKKDMNSRAKYGASPRDCWNFDLYFYNVLRNGLIQYKKDTNGYPALLSEKEWDNVLDRMVFLCEELLKEDLDETTNPGRLWNEYLKSDMKDIELKRKWWEAEKEYSEYLEVCRFELCDLLKEWLPHLWW